ncbi:MAG: hypothetical protein WBN17_00110 [Aureibaculum sp.]
MKKIKLLLVGMLLSAFLLSSTITLAQDTPKNVLVETIYLMPEKGKEKEFEKAVKLHNDTFHGKAPHQAGMNLVLTGPETGWYVWYMGPTTYTDLDTRPTGDHDGDWTAKIDPLVKKYGKTEYWKYEDAISYSPEGSLDTKYSNIWIVDLKRGSWETFKEVMTKVQAVYKKRTGDTFRIYSNQFNADDGRDVAMLFDFNKWAELDEDSNFKADYEAINGKDTFAAFLKEWESITPSIKSAVWLDVFK